ncbi:hypothetical protein [Pseudarthrobacter sp. IC2-21]|uniref:hypothetical protein n=1 Tax=Pseudarthrobacter sp. IC2-21 TaxID=3092262 RepID=UPI002A6B83E4|nr:hypothetical protein [Pseudarthrobacter sp. IC2-21]
MNSELANLLQDHPDTAVFTSFPSIGDTGAAALMAGMQLSLQLLTQPGDSIRGPPEIPSEGAPDSVTGY